MTSLYEKLEKGIDKEWIRRVLQEMVSIRSENPFYESPAAGFREREMAEYLSDCMTSLGLRVEQQEVRPHRPNVFGHLSGTGGRFSLMLAGHTDTARTTGYADAYHVKFGDGKIYGRGACDMKAALAAYLAVVKVLKEGDLRLKGNLILCGNMDEEFQMLGSKYIGQQGPKADQGIIGEPTSLQICPSNKGRVSTKIISRGRAAHSSVPEKGINAIVRMAKILQAFEDYNDELLSRTPHPLCGHGRFTPGVIQGGVQVNMVPDSCELEVDRRTLPGETKEKVYEEFHQRIQELKSIVPDLVYEITEPTWLIAPNDISPSEPVVQALRNAHLAIQHRDPGIQAFVAASDAPYMGFPTVICGPGSIAQAHSTCEFVELDEVATAAKIYLHVVLQLLG
jgi:acetylornithine deacetylase/succinyl-diaminopimelate desuccinylase family protein